MTTELAMQNLISQREQIQGKARQRLAAKKDVDYSNYQLGVTTLPSKGYLVNDPVWKAPVVATQDTFKNIKNIGRGLKGKGNDHDLGNMNSVALQTSGLAIASYLATKRVLPVKKGMEFVGFAAFMTSMVAWPKIFIQAPIQAMYGFNVNQKYVDSQGRKKPFHIDPQYTPWSLYDGKKIDSIGDRMGLNPEMENRRGLVQEKMTKIATQANTMWMLTAGIAVPTMTALISSQVEKLLNKGHQEISTKSEDEKFAKLAEGVLGNKAETSKAENAALDALLAEHEGKEVNAKFVDKVIEHCVGGNTADGLGDDLRVDLHELLHSEPVKLHEFLGEIKIVPDIKINSDIPNPELHMTLPADKIKEALAAKTFNGKAFTGEAVVGGKAQAYTSSHVKNVLAEIIPKVLASKEYQEQIAKVEALPKAKKIDGRGLRQKLRNACDALVDARFEAAPAKLTSASREKIKSIYKACHQFNESSKIMTGYRLNKVGEKEDSVVAREWQKMTEGFAKSMLLTDEEIKATSESPSASRELLDKRLLEIASDKDKYKEAVTKVSQFAFGFDKALNAGAVKEDKKTLGFLEGLSKVTAKVYGDFGEQLEAQGFNATAARVSNIVELNENIEKANNAKKDIGLKSEERDKAIKKAEEAKKAASGKSFPGSKAKAVIFEAENNVTGAKASAMRFLQTLDVYRRIATGQVEKDLMEGKGFGGKKRSKEYAQEVIKHMKFTLMDANLGIHTVKLNIPQKEMYRDVMTQLFYQDRSKVTSQNQEIIREARKWRANDEQDYKYQTDLEKAEVTAQAEEDVAKYTTNLPEKISMDQITEGTLSDAQKAEYQNFMNKVADSTLHEYNRFKTEHSTFDYTSINEIDNKKLSNRPSAHRVSEKFKNKPSSEPAGRRLRLMGETPSQLIQKTTEQAKNTRTWLKMCGGAFAAVGLVTMVAPIFFGKVKEPQSAKKEVSANG